MRSKSFRKSALIVCGLLLVSAAGCQKRHEGPTLAPTSGVVSYKGEPVDGALVIFCPKSPSSPAAYGKTDARGRFQLTTRQPADGAAPGEYRVTLTKNIINGMPPEEANAYYMREHKPPPPPKTTHLLPEKYGDVAKTPIAANVIVGKSNEFQWDLH